MKSTTEKQKDPMGRAIAEYYEKGKAAKLRVFSSLFYEDEIPVKTLFRSFEEMPIPEQTALHLCRGRVLDVGAGSGCHSIELMNRGMEVMAIDISELSVEVMKKRGVDARIVNFFDDTSNVPSTKSPIPFKSPLNVIVSPGFGVFPDNTAPGLRLPP